MHKALEATKNGWNRYKGKIAVVSVVITAATVALALRAGKDIHNFLEAEGLAEKYYPNEDE